MLQTEYVRSLQCNYERLLLDKKPEERRYQYCILNRGGIKGLLPCSLRYIDNQAYLYYDISSRQNIAQLFGEKTISRGWLRDFIWSFQQINQELDRFLLDGRNIIWFPEQIFQDLENNVFSFVYIPYYENETGFQNLLDFWVEHIDYQDEVLVECVYLIHDQFDKNGDVYLQNQIFEDLKRLDNPVENKVPEQEAIQETMQEEMQRDGGRLDLPKEEKKGIFSIFEGRKKKNKEIRDTYRQTMQDAMKGYAVAEEPAYEEEEFGRTVYIEEKTDPSMLIHRFYSPEGKLLASLEKPVLSVGKRRGEVDLVLDDISVSRMHARIIKEDREVYLEDLNSTNGTFKNGLRLEPYEKRKLEEGDEIKCGKAVIIFR